MSVVLTFLALVWLAAWCLGRLAMAVSPRRSINPIHPGVVSTTESSRPPVIPEMGTYAAAADYVPASVLRDIEDVCRDGRPHDWQLAHVRGRTRIELCRTCPQSRSV